MSPTTANNSPAALYRQAPACRGLFHARRPRRHGANGPALRHFCRISSLGLARTQACSVRRLTAGQTVATLKTQHRLRRRRLAQHACAVHPNPALRQRSLAQTRGEGQCAGRNIHQASPTQGSSAPGQARDHRHGKVTPPRQAGFVRGAKTNNIRPWPSRQTAGQARRAAIWPRRRAPQRGKKPSCACNPLAGARFASVCTCCSA